MRPFRYYPLCIVIAIATLAFDLSQPLGVAAGVPYVLLVLLGLFATQYRIVAALTLAASALNVAGFWFSSPGAPLDIVLLNRSVAFLAIWTVGGAMAAVTMQRKSLELQLQFDPLTNCYNRKYLHRALAREIGKWKAHGRPLSVIMLDIDHFKSVNDVHGHQVGDRVLQSVAQACAANVRNADRICRYGGEEFAIILPDADRTAAGVVAERIRTAVREARFESGKGIRVTVSLGVAEMTSAYKNADALMHAADNALYQAKHSGRNRVNIDNTCKLIHFPA